MLELLELLELFECSLCCLGFVCYIIFLLKESNLSRTLGFFNSFKMFPINLIFSCSFWLLTTHTIATTPLIAHLRSILLLTTTTTKDVFISD
jgi:hypothetical protein